MPSKRGAVLALSFLSFAACGASLHAQASPAQVLTERARTLDAQGRPDLAVEYWRQVLLIQPRDVAGLTALSRYFRSIGDQTQAKHYTALLEQVQPGAAIASRSGASAAPNADAMLGEAVHLAARHKNADAVALFRQAFGSSEPPDNWAVAYYEAEAALPDSQPHAIAGLRALAEKYPANPSYLLALGELLTYHPSTRLEGVRLLSSIHGTAQQNEQARLAWKQALLWDVNSPATTQTAKLYLERFPDADLSSSLTSANAKKSQVKQTSPLGGEGFKALAQGNLDIARSRFSALAAEHGGRAQGEAGLGYVCMKRKDFADAVLHFEQAKASGLHTPALEKTLKEARYWAAMAEGNNALADRDTSKATYSFEQARTVNGERPEATEALGGSLLAEQNAKQAEAVFLDDLTSNPGRPDAWIGWMNAALENGHPQELLTRQSRMPQSVKLSMVRRPDYLALLASAELATGNTAAAARILDRVHQIAASSPGQGGQQMVTAARLLLRRGYFDQSAELCLAAVKSDESNSDAWQTLVQAEHAAGQDATAVRIATRMPHNVDASAMHNPDFLLTLAAVYQSQKRLDIASTLLDRVAQLENLDGRSLAALDLQRASFALASGDPHKAYTLYRKVKEQAPDQPDAWAGMIDALHVAKRDSEALEIIQKLPPKAMERLRLNTGFLETAAFVYNENGRTREAMLCLAALTRHYSSQHQPIPFSVDTDYAWLLLNAGKDDQLGATLARLNQTPNLSIDQMASLARLWSTWSIRRAEAEYQNRNGKRAVTLLEAALHAYPQDVQLQTELASMYVRTGSPRMGMMAYLNMSWSSALVSQFAAAIDSAVAAHSLSYADLWLKLGLQQHPGDVVLLRAGAQVEEQRGHRKQAERYLEAAMGDMKPQSGSKDALLSQLAANSNEDPANGSRSEQARNGHKNSPRQALEQMLAGGSAANVETADSSEQSGESPAWSATAAASHTAQRGQPTYPAITPLAYERPQAGETREADSPYANEGSYQPIAAYRFRSEDASAEREAAAPEQASANSAWSIDDSPVAPEPLPVARSSDRNEHLRHVKATRSDDAWSSSDDPLAGLGLGIDNSSDSEVPAGSGTENASSNSADAGSLEDLLSNRPARSAPRTFADSLAPEAARPDSTTSSSSLLDPAPVHHLVSRMDKTSEQQASDDLTELESRYSPWLSTGGSVESHSGTPGYDHLQRYESALEASSVVGGGAARLTVISRPVLLQSGIPDVKSNYRFGSGGGAPQDAQFASGLGSELQFATRSLQTSVGSTPSNFLVSNVVGSFALRPRQGPITLRGYRSQVQDSLLSYAGMRDSNSNQIWGGVIQTGAALEFNKGGADSGFYASVDGARLTGLNVLDNTRIMGNAGAYWMAYANQYGRLKVGANFTAMHYARNERYFTLGQGGYFSPNAFLTMNAPVTWEGRPIYNTSYQISGSIGTQNIQEDQALAGSLIVGNGVQTTTGAGYDLHARVAHRMSPHWIVEGFFDANNARQYSDKATGFSVRFLKYAQPANFAPALTPTRDEIRPLQNP